MSSRRRIPDAVERLLGSRGSPASCPRDFRDRAGSATDCPPVPIPSTYGRRACPPTSSRRAVARSPAARRLGRRPGRRCRACSTPWSRRLAERLGFRAVYLSGGALSAATGVPDVGLLTLTEFVDEARRIAQATSLPLLCDADTGFGEALNVERTVRLFEAAGVAGIHLEDQELPKRCGHLSGKSLVEPEAMAAKIRAAVAARRDPDFVIIARTDARGVTGFDDAVRRAQALSRRRGRRDLPRGAGVGRRVRPLRQGGAGAAAGQHDRVRQEPAPRRRRPSGRWATGWSCSR